MKEAITGQNFDAFWFSMKFSAISAAVGVVQMQHIRELLWQRQELARTYVKLLGDDSRIALPRITAGGEASWQSFCLKIAHRDAVMNNVRAQGIEVQFGAFALHQQPAFRPGAYCRWAGSLAGSKQAFEEALVLPLHHALLPGDQEQVARAVRTALSALDMGGIAKCAG